MRDTPINRLEQAWSKTQPNGGSPTGIKQRTQVWEANAESYVRAHPQVALAAAAVAGVLLGWMIKRR